MKTKKLSKNKVKCNVLGDSYYGGHEIFTGYYNEPGEITMWTQLGDDGENNGQPALDIIITDDIIRIDSGDADFTGEWNIPCYMAEMKEISKEIDKVLERYYSQWIEQPQFVKKEK